MDDVDEGPMLTDDELELLRTTLAARLEALEISEESDKSVKEEGTRASFVAVYRQGQRRVLRAALKEVDAIMG